MNTCGKKILSLLFLSTSTILASCGNSSFDAGNYVESEYCRTNMAAIGQSKYPIVGQVKKVQPYKKTADGNYTSEGVSKVDPFDTNLIYTLYSNSYLTSYKEVMKIESITGKYVFDTHKLFDRHYYYLDENNRLINNLKVVNDNYGGEWIAIEDDLFQVLKIAMEVTRFSQGKFNLFIGELSDYWDRYINDLNADWDFASETQDPEQTEEGKRDISRLVAETPTYQEIDDVLEFDESKKQVRFNRYKDAEKVSISLGGIGKGYLTENLYQKFKKEKLTDGASYAGASSIVFMDKRSDNNPWTVQMSNPYGYYYNPLGRLKIDEKYALSTSGAQVNYYYTYVDGILKLRHHIIDASTGYPQDYYNQVTLISKTISSAVMDTLSTVLINCPENEIEALIRKFRDQYGDLECTLSKRTATEDGKRSIDMFLTKNMKEKQIFSEEPADDSPYYIPVNYKYLDF